MTHIYSPVEIVLTIIALSFWFLFPIAIFLSVSRLDKNTDQIVRLGQLSHEPIDEPKKAKTKEVKEQKEQAVWRPRKWARH